MELSWLLMMTVLNLNPTAKGPDQFLHGPGNAERLNGFSSTMLIGVPSESVCLAAGENHRKTLSRSKYASQSVVFTCTKQSGDEGRPAILISTLTAHPLNPDAKDMAYGRLNFSQSASGTVFSMETCQDAGLSHRAAIAKELAQGSASARNPVYLWRFSCTPMN